jgi:peptidoglycan hydrolase-like protein with peptidoglycan-binding domain
MKKYFTVVMMTVLLSGCQNSASPANTIPTQQTGARATIHITRTQEDAIETQEDDVGTEEISLNESAKPVVTEKNVESKGNAYPGYALKMDTKKYDANVKKVQAQLNAALDYQLTVDGYFGKATKDAVMYVQEQNNVEVDGIVGPVTWDIIFNNIGGGTPDAAVGMDDDAYPGYPLVMDTKKYDANVKKVQARLNTAVGYDLAEDGYFGQATKDAVMYVQEENGVEVDGVVGPVTWDIIFNNTGDVGGDE